MTCAVWRLVRGWCDCGLKRLVFNKVNRMFKQIKHQEVENLDLYYNGFKDRILAA
jgi:hypothetical protein